jgi:hypothetical protein
MRLAATSKQFFPFPRNTQGKSRLHFNHETKRTTMSQNKPTQSTAPQPAASSGPSLDLYAVALALLAALLVRFNLIPPIKW